MRNLMRVVCPCAALAFGLVQARADVAGVGSLQAGYPQLGQVEWGLAFGKGSEEDTSRSSETIVGEHHEETHSEEFSGWFVSGAAGFAGAKLSLGRASWENSETTSTGLLSMSGSSGFSHRWGASWVHTWSDRFGLEDDADYVGLENWNGDNGGLLVLGLYYDFADEAWMASAAIGIGR